MLSGAAGSLDPHENEMRDNHQDSVSSADDGDNSGVRNGLTLSQPHKLPERGNVMSCARRTEDRRQSTTR